MKTEPNKLEAILEPDLPIIDTHHHLWGRTFVEVLIAVTGRPRYVLEDLLADAEGHNIVASVVIESHSTYRADGPEDFKVVGETEFFNGQAALSASGAYGESRIAAGIVGAANLLLGDQARPVLEAHIAAGNGRFRGVRQSGAWDRDEAIRKIDILNAPEGLYRSDVFRKGFSHLQALELSFEAFILSPQIPDVADLAKAFPQTRIVLEHVGNPVGMGPYKGKHDEVFANWKRDIQELAKHPNVSIKLGGLGNIVSAFPSFRSTPPASSEQLAAEWGPYLETAIAAFGPGRSMFESNYPTDTGSGTYRTIWNAFKRIAAGYSADEKKALFAGTAADFYRLNVKKLLPSS